MANSIDEYIDKALNDDTMPRGELGPWYNPFGDSIHVMIRAEEPVAEWVDDFLTIYRSIDTNEVIGFKLKGIRKLFELFGIKEFEVTGEVENGKLEIVSYDFHTNPQTPGVALHDMMLAALKESTIDNTSAVVNSYGEVMRSVPVDDKKLVAS